jgi:hypothetical protein
MSVIPDPPTPGQLPPAESATQCIDCGSGTRLPLIHGRCAVCRVRQGYPASETAVPGAPALALSLSLPPDTVFFVTDDDECLGYITEYLGVPGPKDPARPYIEYERDDERLDLQIWRARVYREDRPEWLEVTWLPGTGASLVLGGLPARQTNPELWDTRCNLLQTIPGAYLFTAAGGRPRDPEEDALTEMVGWAAEYLRRHPGTRIQDLGRAEVQAYSGMSLSGLNKRMAAKHITLRKIRARLQEFWGVSGSAETPTGGDNSVNTS